MNIYDKARWQIEGSFSENDVITHFKFMFEWLRDYNLLNEYGLQTLRDGIDEEAIITDEMVNSDGKIFLDKYYDQYVAQIQYGVQEDADLLKQLYLNMQST